MNLEFYIPQIIKSILVLLIFLILRYMSIQVIKRYAKKFERLEHRTGLIIKHVDFAIIFFVILFFTLIWGVQIKDLGLVMSSVFAVIGVGFFAQWSILSNITSGIIMFFTFPYKIGDYIKIHDKEFPYEGMIEDIKSFHIIVRTKDNDVITYPNSMMLQKGVTVIKAEEYHESIQEEEGQNKNLTDHGTD
ncbi:mechanosensitive ion channel [Marixanthomonas sp. SCSIO 43207]|uniref:mechanosensitive ion channel domain-containing protein n=1 Tax=Marixanthomonas sp. SCSIO 43207 TaxID=2779360 RepID=UPI001CA86B9E|nr:mechanosensitive ion channel domain-containing protein [Marixanthomonas sp. SCSIO 43207]UAB80804.1 mechanosensitive ion channel [Marixanthomonas sp. SCSIO 43207]